MFQRNDQEAAVHFGIVALVTCIFILDFFTRLGLAEWFLYVVPIGL